MTVLFADLFLASRESRLVGRRRASDHLVSVRRANATSSLREWKFRLQRQVAE